MPENKTSSQIMVEETTKTDGTINRKFYIDVGNLSVDDIQKYIKNNKASNKSIFPQLLTTLFIGLKLTSAITWGWLWVVSPLIISVALYICYKLLELSIKKYRNKLNEELEEAAEEIHEVVENIIDKAEDKISDIKDDVKDNVEKIKDKAEDVIDDVKDKVEEIKDKAEDVVAAAAKASSKPNKK